MMNHFAQESRSGSVLAERRAPLYPHKRVMVGWLHCATGRMHRLHSRLIHRLKQLNADAHQDQKYVPIPFHFKSECKITKKIPHTQMYAGFFCYFKFLLKNSANLSHGMRFLGSPFPAGSV